MPSRTALPSLKYGDLSLVMSGFPSTPPACRPPGGGRRGKSVWIMSFGKSPAWKIAGRYLGLVLRAGGVAARGASEHGRPEGARKVLSGKAGFDQRPGGISRQSRSPLDGGLRLMTGSNGADGKRLENEADGTCSHEAPGRSQTILYAGIFPKPCRRPICYNMCACCAPAVHGQAKACVA